MSTNAESLAMFYEEALRSIAEEREPCTKCGKPHEFVKGTPPTWGSWAAEDGHAYYRADAKRIARDALATGTGASL